MSPAHEELRKLLDRYLQESLTEPELRRLQELAAADAGSRDFYCQYLLIHAGLQWHFRDEATLTPAFHGDSGPVASLPTRLPQILNRPVYWAVTAAGVLFAGYIALISWNMLDRRLPESTVGGEPVAMLVASHDAEWGNPESALSNPKSEIEAGKPLEITSGIVELKLKQGTTLVVEGPADWQITGKNSARLTRGKLVAKVPREAVGFTLETPEAKIVDLGTEFGVEVAENGGAEVHVVSGKVDVQGSNSAGKEQSSPLRAGQSIQVTSEGISGPIDSPAIPQKFARLVESGKQPPAESVTNPIKGLVAYYPFDGDLRDHAAEVAANSGKTADDLKLIGQGEFLAGQVGKGLRLTGGFASAPLSPDVKLPPTFTIEAWVVAESLTSGYQRIVLNWGDDPTPIRVYHLSIKSRGLELAVGQTNNQYVRAEGGELKIERWQHIAGVADGKNLHVYLNGEEVATTPFDGTLAENDQEGLGVGDSQQGQGPTMRFRGAIDELALWDVALSPEQIAAHAARGRHGYDLARNRTPNGPSRISPLGDSEESPRHND